MTQIIYAKWEVFLFSQVCGDVRLYFAVAPEMCEVCHDIKSFDGAFSKLKEAIDRVNALIDSE